MKLQAIALDGGRLAKVDISDYEVLIGFAWYIDDKGYATTGHGARTRRMHQLVLKAPRDRLVDHVNGDRLDNRMCNLRVCTPAQNQWNRGKPRTTAKVASRYKGVSWDKTNLRWRSKIVVAGKQMHLGYFADEVSAAHAYDAAAQKHFGEYGRLNFPE